VRELEQIVVTAVKTSQTDCPGCGTKPWCAVGGYLHPSRASRTDLDGGGDPIYALADEALVHERS
jgi:hypothetical protein